MSDAGDDGSGVDYDDDGDGGGEGKAKRRRRKKDDWSPASKPDRSTKQPQNKCETCQYTWYPRGKSRSLKCPSCGSRNVKVLGGCCGPAALLALSLFAGTILLVILL